MKCTWILPSALFDFIVESPPGFIESLARSAGFGNLTIVSEDGRWVSVE